jgi:hypothetical protein
VGSVLLTSDASLCGLLRQAGSNVARRGKRRAKKKLFDRRDFNEIPREH